MGSSITARLARIERRLPTAVRDTGCAACDRATDWPLVFCIEESSSSHPVCPTCGRERGLVFRIVKVSEESAVEN